MHIYTVICIHICIHTHTHTHVYTYIWRDVGVCVYGCICILVIMYMYVYVSEAGGERAERPPAGKSCFVFVLVPCVRARAVLYPWADWPPSDFPFFPGHFPFPFGLGRASLFPRGALLLGLGGPWRALLFGLGGLFPLASEGGLCSQVLKRREKEREKKKERRERKKEREERERERDRQRETERERVSLEDRNTFVLELPRPTRKEKPSVWL